MVLKEAYSCSQHKQCHTHNSPSIAVKTSASAFSKLESLTVLFAQLKLTPLFPACFCVFLYAKLCQHDRSQHTFCGVYVCLATATNVTSFQRKWTCRPMKVHSALCKACKLPCTESITSNIQYQVKVWTS